MNPNSVILFKIASMVGGIPANNVLQTLKDLLGISRCTFWQVCEQLQECEIITGLPLEDHSNSIGKKYILAEHPDIKFIANSQESHNLIENPRENKLTRYFCGIIEEKGINAIGYFRVFYSFLSDDEKKEKKGMGVLVVDACGKKTTLDPDELNQCRTAAKLIAARLVSFEDFLLVLYNEWEDAVRNPATVIGGLARRLQKIAETTENIKLKEYSLKIKEEVEKIEKNV
jgi:hypothetical protein